MRVLPLRRIIHRLNYLIVIGLCLLGLVGFGLAGTVIGHGQTSNTEAAAARNADFAQGYAVNCAAANADRFALQRVLILIGRDQVSRYVETHDARDILFTVPGMEAFWRGLLLLVPPRDCAKELATILQKRRGRR